MNFKLRMTYLAAFNDLITDVTTPITDPDKKLKVAGTAYLNDVRGFEFIIFYANRGF